jgi:uncharacterized protein YuzB (UPF0349 family)
MTDPAQCWMINCFFSFSSYLTQNTVCLITENCFFSFSIYHTRNTVSLIYRKLFQLQLVPYTEYCLSQLQKTDSSNSASTLYRKQSISVIENCFFSFSSYLTQNTFCLITKNCVFGYTPCLSVNTIIWIMKTNHGESLHVSCLLVLPNFILDWNSSTTFNRNIKYKISGKTVRWKSLRYIRADSQEGRS